MKRPGRVAATVEVHRQPYLQRMVSGDRYFHFFGTLHEGLWILDIASGIRKFFDLPTLHSPLPSKCTCSVREINACTYNNLKSASRGAFTPRWKLGIFCGIRGMQS